MYILGAAQAATMTPLLSPSGGCWLFGSTIYVRVWQFQPRKQQHSRSDGTKCTGYFYCYTQQLLTVLAYIIFCYKLSLFLGCLCAVSYEVEITDRKGRFPIGDKLRPSYAVENDRFRSELLSTIFFDGTRRPKKFQHFHSFFCTHQ